MSDILKLTEEAKADFMKWAKIQLSQSRDALGRTNDTYDVLKKRVLSIYDDIIKRQSEITTIKSNMQWHANWIATLKQEIRVIEDAIGIIEPNATQKTMLAIQDKISEGDTG